MRRQDRPYYGARQPLSTGPHPDPLAEAMGPRENPLHPMFRDHNCYRCKDGEKPCVQGGPHRCEYPHARND